MTEIELTTQLPSRAFFNELVRTDLNAFIERCFNTVSPNQSFLDNWHVQAYAHYLRECQAGNCNRIIINVPPRYLKSISTSVAFVAWILGHDPTARIICVSYSSDLAAKHSRDCRRVMETPWYKQIFPKTRISPKKNTETEFETTAGGYRYATSVGGTLTGRGGNFIIIDDPMKPEDAYSESARKRVLEWYTNTLQSRLDNKERDSILLVMQRLHVEDLSGHLLEGGGWAHLNLAAIAERPDRIQIGCNRWHDRNEDEILHEERESGAKLRELRRQMGERDFSAQYQQSPTPPDGALIKQKWFRYYDIADLDLRKGTIIQSWDTACKSGELHDFSVCTTWLHRRDDREYYLLDVFRDRLDYPSLRYKARKHSLEYSAYEILIEDAGSGTQLYQDLRSERVEGGARLRSVIPVGDKIVRMSGQTAPIEAGRVFLPREAPWLGDFLKEMLAFPEGKHDDQVDSVSQFLNHVEKRNVQRITSRDL